MKFLKEDQYTVTYEGVFMGQKVIMYKIKKTGETSINTDSLAQVLGFKNHDHMMSDPDIQNMVKDYQAATGLPAFTEVHKPNNIN